MVRRMRVGVVDVGGGVREGGGSRGLGVCGGLCCVRVCVRVHGWKANEKYVETGQAFENEKN